MYIFTVILSNNVQLDYVLHLYKILKTVTHIIY